MDLKLLNSKGDISGTIKVSDILFDRVYNEALIHQLITSYLSNARFATRAQKTRAEVNHSTRKPWRQKGTGRARAGMSSSPIWKGGGRAFPNKPNENFSKKINKKMYRAGMATILSQLVRDDRLFVIDSLSITEPKTKYFIKYLEDMKFKEDVLFLTNNLDENVYLSSRNLNNTLVLEVKFVDPYSLLRFKKTILTKDAVNKLEEQWGE